MSNSSFYGSTGTTNNQTDAIEASVNNAAASETSAAASSATSAAQATISTDKAAESAASAAEALVSKNAAAVSSASAATSSSSASSSASAASGSAAAASSSAGTASTKASQASAAQSSASSSASTSSSARDASIVAKDASVVAQGLSEAARDASIVAKDASVVAKTSSETAATNSAASSTTSSTKAAESAASAASALSNKNSSDTNSATATTKASEAATSATAAASSATASAASATTSTASKDTAIAVTANFLGAHSSAPTQTGSGGSLAVGMLYFDTTSDVLKVRASGGWINAGSSVNGTSARFAYTLTGGQDTVSGNDTSGNALAYDSGFADVYLNGVKLAAADFTATSGTSVVLAAEATAGDILEVVAFGTFQLSNGSFTGTTTVQNLAVTGTVDGQDVAAMGTKLSGIENNATADQTKSDIEGLGIDVPAANLTGTIDAARLSTATTQAESDDSTKIATTAYVVDKITTLIGGAPSTLNDLSELASAINNDSNYNSTLTTALATKLPLAGGTMTGALTTTGQTINNAGQSQSALSIGGGSTNAALTLRGSTGSAYAWQVSSNAHVASALEFTRSTAVGGTTFSTPSVVINSSGSVLLGTTDTTLYNNTTGTGTKLGGDGRLDVARSADTVATFNRTGSSDGEIIRLVTSGDTLGSIGSVAGDKMTIIGTNNNMQIGAAGANVFNVSTNSVYPQSHNAVDLGFSTSIAWRHLYLSGRSRSANVTVGSGTASTYVDVTINGASTSNYGPMLQFQQAGSLLGKLTNYGSVQGGTSNDFFLTSTTTNHLVLGTNNAARVRIRDDGKIGINTSGANNYSMGIHMHGSGHGSSLHLTDNSTGSAGSDGVEFLCYQGIGYLWNRENNAWIIGTNEQERMRIGSSAVTFNTTGSVAGQGVTTYSNGANGHYVSVTGTSNYWITNHGVSSATGTLSTFYNNGTYCGGISISNTNVTSYVSASDYRLKENVAPMTGATERLKQLNPVTFDWINSGEASEGFLAHEVGTVVPMSTTGIKDEVYNEEGAADNPNINSGDPKYQSVDPAKLVPLLVKTIQELEARITALEAN